MNFVSDDNQMNFQNNQAVQFDQNFNIQQNPVTTYYNPANPVMQNTAPQDFPMQTFPQQQVFQQPINPVVNEPVVEPLFTEKEQDLIVRLGIGALTDDDKRTTLNQIQENAFWKVFNAILDRLSLPERDQYLQYIQGNDDQQALALLDSKFSEGFEVFSRNTIVQAFFDFKNMLKNIQGQAVNNGV